jgi:twitching motility two-component system response regulator PilH
MVVDDDEDMRSGIVAILTMNNYSVVEADNGTDALDLITLHPPDLIISDVMMANMNGFMLRESLLENPETASIPMILISGYAKDAGAWKADAAVEYLAKPFTFDELMVVVERTLK